jgi:mannose-1-phosphate guanylyltransferase
VIQDAIILAGGFGTRLEPLTLERPKSLLPVNQRPFLESQFRRLSQAGAKRVVLSVFHQSGKIARALPGLKKFGLKVSLRREARPLGTGGAIRFAWPKAAQSCLVLNGDVLSDASIAPLLKAHQGKEALATLWLIHVKDTGAFGVIEMERSGRVQRFVEKPKPGQSSSHLVNAGLYAMERGVLERIPAGRPVSVEREIFPALLAEGAAIYGFMDAEAPYWNDIGTPAAYLRANLDAAAGKVKIPGFWPPAARGKVLNVIGPRAKLGKGARLEGCLLIGGNKVGEGARLKGCILGPGAEVEAGLKLEPGTVLGAGAKARFEEKP